MNSKQKAVCSKQSRIAWIDLVEVIAIWLVVFYHCSMFGFTVVGEYAGVAEHIHYVLRVVSTLGVPLFFFVNGYLLFHKPFDFKKHLRRSFRFMILAVIWAMISILTYTLITGGNLSPRAILSSIWHLQAGSNHIWYLGALVCVYIFFPLFKIVYDQNYRVFLYFTIISGILTIGNNLLNILATLAINILRGRTAPIEDVNFFWEFNPFRGIYGFAFFYFLLGGVIVKLLPRILKFASKRRNIIAASSLVGSMLCLALLGYGYSRLATETWDTVWMGYSTIFTLIGVLSVWVLSLNFQRPVRLITLLSRHTLGIYFLHILIIYALTTLAISFAPGFIDFCSTFIGSLVYSIIILALSLGSTLVVSKIPLLRHLV